MRLARLASALMVLLAAPIAMNAAQAAAATGPAQSDAASDAPAQPMRASVRTDRQARGEAIAGREQVIWLQSADSRIWLGAREAYAPVRGSMLLLAPEDGAVNDGGRAAALWRSMPRHGWHTYYLSLPPEAVTADVVKLAQKEMPTLDRFVLVCEAQGCLRWIETRGVLGSIATVYLNLPVRKGYAPADELRQAWPDVQPPGLIIQEQPLAWIEELRLAGDFELHLLPRSRVGRVDTPVERKLRGWLKRRLRASG